MRPGEKNMVQMKYFTNPGYFGRQLSQVAVRLGSDCSRRRLRPDKTPL